MNFYSLSDQLMFKTLKNISFGVIYLTNFDNRKYILGSTDHKLKANIKINKPVKTLKYLLDNVKFVVYFTAKMKIIKYKGMYCHL